MADTLEYKLAPTEFKAAGDTGQYAGHFSIFGNVATIEALANRPDLADPFSRITPQMWIIMQCQT